VSSRAALARHPLAIAGIIIATVSAVVFLALAIAVATGLFENPYAGIVVVLALPALFGVGVLLTLAGMRLQRRKIERGAAEDWPVLDFRQQAVRRGVLLVAALTSLSLVIMLIGGYSTLHSMESPKFCGLACHTPMHPQYTAWQAAPHSNVQCTQCHIGENARAMLHYKLVGVRQLFHVVTNQIPKPIPGIADMRPALEICGNCHWPDRGAADHVRIVREYADDETNSETTTILQMHLGGPGQPTTSGRAIHWHADPRINITYVATDTLRQTIPFVKVTDAQGKVREFVTEGTTPAQLAQGQQRTMDCIDCHNVVAHRIAPTAERAVDEAIAAGKIDRTLPFVRREAVRLLKADYPAPDAGLRAIEEGLRTFYAPRAGAIDARKLDQAVASARAVYGRNVFPSMKVTFGVYPDNLGHTTSSGCFRCHDGSHTAKDGTTISADCEYCHRQIEAPTPAAATKGAALNRQP
jgi:nitrate/TMAO reductase-like tetraheme cytochrome c subunit